MAATSTSTTATSILNACVVRNGDLDLTSPTTCSSLCSGGDTSVMPSVVLAEEAVTTVCTARNGFHIVAHPEAMPTPVPVDVADCAPTMAAPSANITLSPRVLTPTTTKPASKAALDSGLIIVPPTTSSVLNKPDGDDTATANEDEKMLAGSGVEGLFAFVTVRDVTDDHNFVTRTSAMPHTLAALSVDDGRVANKHKVLSPLKLLVPFSKRKEPYVSSLLQQCIQAMVTWGTFLNQLHANYNGMYSDLGCATSCLLPWDPGEKTWALKYSVLSTDTVWGTCVKQLNADSVGSFDHRQKLRQYMERLVACALTYYPAIFVEVPSEDFLSGFFGLVQNNCQPQYLEVSESCYCSELMFKGVAHLGPEYIPWKIAWLLVLSADPCSGQRSPCDPMEPEMHALFLPACGCTILQGSLVHHVYAKCSSWILQYPLAANLELCHPWHFSDGAQPGGMIPVFQFVAGNHSLGPVLFESSSCGLFPVAKLGVHLQSEKLWLYHPSYGLTFCLHIIYVVQDELSCSFLFGQQLEPWPSWENSLLVTVYHQHPPAKPPDKSNYIPAYTREKVQWTMHIVDCFCSCICLEHSGIMFEFTFSGQKGQYSTWIILMSDGAIHFDPEYFLWEIAWMLVGYSVLTLAYTSSWRIMLAWFLLQYGLAAGVILLLISGYQGSSHYAILWRNRTVWCHHSVTATMVWSVQLLEFFRTIDQGGNFNPTGLCAHCLDPASYFNKVCAIQVCYLDVFRDQVCFDYDTYCDLSEVLKHDLSEVLKHQVPWDPGGLTRHRLEGKANFKEGGMLATFSNITVGPDLGLTLLGLGFSDATKGCSYTYQKIDYMRVGLERDGFGLLCYCLLLPLVSL